jgi:hypothetical protein
VARKKIKYKCQLSFFFTFDCIRSRNQYLRFVCGKKKKIGMLEQLFLNLDCIDADRPGNRPSKSKGRMGPKVSKKKILRAEWRPNPWACFKYLL